MQKNNFFDKLRSDAGTRAIALTVTVMLLVLTAIIITTVVANRATGDDGTVLPPAEETPVPDDSKPTVEDLPAEDTPADTLPTRFLLPVSGVLRAEHDPTLQVFSPTMHDYRVHLGIDIGTMAGATVSAMADGTVAQIWEDVSFGHCIAVKHGGEAYTIYKNLSATPAAGIAVGSVVKAGDTLGTVGDSAMVEIGEEPHLHVEMTVNGLPVDPLEYLDEDAIATLNEDTNYEDVS